MRAEVKVLLIGGGLGIFGLILTFSSLPAIAGADQFSRYSYLNSISISVILGAYFWYLQKKDSEKIQEVLDNQNAIIEKINKRDTARKQFWVGVAINQIRELVSCHESVISDYQDMLAKPHSNEELTEIHYGLEGNYYYANSEIVPKLFNAIAQLADLFEDNSLITDIMAESLDESPNYKFVSLLEHADADHSEEKMTADLQTLHAKIREIQEFQKRFESEMPSKLL